MKPNWELLNQIRDAVWAFVVEHQSYFLGLLAGLAAAWFAAWKARRTWRRRAFLSRVNFSVNYIDGGVLRFRTLRESDLDTILLKNEHGKNLVLRAAHATTLSRPFLDLPPEESWLVLNSVLNELSEQFATGFLAASIGAPTRVARYVFGLTCEKDPDVRVNKIRVMLITESLLEKLPQLNELNFERPNHRVRLETLKRMRDIYHNEKRKHLLMAVDLAVPVPPAVER